MLKDFEATEDVESMGMSEKACILEDLSDSDSSSEIPVNQTLEVWLLVE
jgi:hypothetical protein